MDHNDKSNNNMFSIQAQIRRNAEEQSSALKDLTSWEKNIKEHDTRLQQKSCSKNGYQPSKEEEKTNILLERDLSIPSNKKVQLSSIINAKNGKRVEVNNKVCSKASENDEDVERKKGNDLYSQGKFQEAIKVYTRWIQMNSRSCIAYSNRAMAYLKVKEWATAEIDASSALDIDNLHVKSYQRRSTARLNLGKLRASLKDLCLAEAAAFEVSVKVPSRIQFDKKKVKDALHLAIKRAPRRKILATITKAKKTKENKASTDVTFSKKTTVLNQPIPMSCNESRVKFTSPQNWIQFEQTWKSLKKRIDKVKFLSIMKPQEITKLYKNGLEDANLLVDLLVCSVDVTNSMDFLQSISKIPSIDMVFMMMTQDQRDIATAAIDSALEKTEGQIESISLDLKGKFGLK